MLKKLFFAVSFGFLCGGNAPAQGTAGADTRLAGAAVYSDPGFQDFIETAYGYLNPRHKLLPAGNFRDAPASPAAAAPVKPAPAAAKAGKAASAVTRKKAGQARRFGPAAEKTRSGRPLARLSLQQRPRKK